MQAYLAAPGGAKCLNNNRAIRERIYIRRQMGFALRKPTDHQVKMEWKCNIFFAPTLKSAWTVQEPNSSQTT